MKRPASKMVSPRISEEAFDALKLLADRQNMSQAAVVEKLILDAAKGSEAYYGRTAAIQSWLAANLAIEILAKVSPTELHDSYKRIVEASVGLFGPIPPRPDDVLWDAAADPRVDAVFKAFGVVK